MSASPQFSLINLSAVTLINNITHNKNAKKINLMVEEKEKEEVVNNVKEEKYRLKRTNPIKRYGSTLDSFLIAEENS
jgi:hypothetical protein